MIPIFLAIVAAAVAVIVEDELRIRAAIAKAEA
jgi:hypothetical protein